MILTGKKIQEEVANRNITIIPFNSSQITTNSYDLQLGPKFIRYTEEILDPKKDNRHEEIVVGEKGITLDKGDFLLGHSMEQIGSDHYVPIIHAKSSIARLGLFVHVTADLIDIGYTGTVTFQLYATRKITIYPEMLIGQVTFWTPKGEIELYDGKYQNGSGPLVSRVHQDFSASKQI